MVTNNIRMSKFYGVPLPKDPSPSLSAYAHPERLVTGDWLYFHLDQTRSGYRRIRRGRTALGRRTYSWRGEGLLAR